MGIVGAVVTGAELAAELGLVLEAGLLELGLLELALGVGLLELELHAATVSAATAAAAMAGTRSRFDLFIECLLSCGVPGVRSPGLAEPRAGWPTPRRPEG